MFQPTVKFEKPLWTRIERVAAAAGYSSPREFVLHVMEKELARLEDAGTKEELLERLKGLGYLE
ncbi:MAG TPA: hypothetical protein VMH81_18255 [Bryobacteraceae bacterium]|nr:hypothetical protein [Bryobacteraceae bacterium]